MAIQFPSVGSIVYQTFAVDTIALILSGLNTQLVAAGWTSSAFGSQLVETWTGVPTNGQTLTVGGVTYTFDTSLNNGVANHILIAANFSLQAQYIADAINHGSGSGTEWSAPTSANPNVTAAQNGSGVITYTSTTSGSSGATFTIAFSGGTSVQTVDTATSYGQGYFLSCPATPQGLTGGIYVRHVTNAFVNTDCVFVTLANADGTGDTWKMGTFGFTGGAPLYPQAGRLLTIAANAHQFIIFLLNDSGTIGCNLGVTVPYIRSVNAPLGVTAASNASPIQITASGHGLTTGQQVYISGIVGNTAANGFWTVTVVDVNNFTLDGSTGNGAYASGGLMGLQNQTISRMMILWGDNQNNSGHQGYDNTFRNALRIVPVLVYLYNEKQYNDIGGNGGGQTVLTVTRDGDPFNGAFFYNVGGTSEMSDPRIAFATPTSASAITIVGQLWAAAVVGDQVPKDRTAPAVGSPAHDYVCLTDNSTQGSLWLATS